LKSSAPLQAGVGVATGLVVVGDLIGSGAAQEQTVVGETPNLAARLQGIAEPKSNTSSSARRNLFSRLWEGMSVAGTFVDAPPVIAKETPALAQRGKAAFERQYLPHRSGRCCDRARRQSRFRPLAVGTRAVVVAEARQGLEGGDKAGREANGGFRTSGHSERLLLFATVWGGGYENEIYRINAGDFTFSTRGERADNGADGRGSM